MSLTFETPVCGCLGCRDSAVAIVRHPNHGRRAVCEDHAGDYEVIERV